MLIHLFASTWLLGAVASPQVQFTDATAAAGLTTLHVPAPGHPMVSLAAGGSVGDFNNDGYADLYVTSGGTTPDKLFINDGTGVFTDQAASWGLTDKIYGCGIAVGDYDRNGWQDIYVSSFGLAPYGPTPGSNRLYRNNGDSTFTEVAALAGVQWASNDANSFGAAFGDYDLDGWLDLMVLAYHPVADPNRLYHNNGDGTFTDVTAAAGLNISSMRGLACSFSDMDNDRYPELILIGDTGTSEYYINNRDGTFTWATNRVEDLNKPNGMGIATGDYDGDGDFDFYVSDIYFYQFGSGGNRLYWNQGDHYYTEGGRAAGVYYGGWGWGVAAFDFDKDGWLDLTATNGWAGQWGMDPSCLFHNQGDSTFVDVAASVGFTHKGQGRSLLTLDADHDGDLDLAISGMKDEFKFYRNDTVTNHSWLDVMLDTSANPRLAPNGIGTVIQAKIGKYKQLRQIDSCQSYLGQNELVAHFGLARATKVDELEIRWSDGFTTRLKDVAVNQRLTVRAQPVFSQSALVRGTEAELLVTGADPGEWVQFLYSEIGLGPSKPIPRLGGLVLDVMSPVTMFGTAIAGPLGAAHLRMHVPFTVPPVPIFTQATILRGPGATNSVKSNAIADVIQ